MTNFYLMRSFAICCFVLDVFAVDDLPAIHVLWGVYPTDSVSGNKTVLYERVDGVDSPMSVQDFTNEWIAAVLLVGDGGWDENHGWVNARWISKTPKSTEGVSPNFENENLVWVFGKTDLPLTIFGDWEQDDSGAAAESDMKEWYIQKWRSMFAANVVLDKTTGEAFCYSDQPGGSAIVGCDSLQIDSLWSSKFGDGGHPPIRYNNAIAIVRTPSRKVYIGPQIPPYCIWMADFGLTREELAQYPASRVQAAFEARVHPSDKSLDATLLLLQ